MSEVTLAAPLSGWLMNIRDVPDPVFSEGMMGEGFAIDPTDGAVTAPCTATVLQVAPTQHSVTLRTKEGAELLIHVGLETVALEGRGFKAHVSEGVAVEKGETLISFDIDLVGLEAKSLITPVVLTNGEGFAVSLPLAGKVVGAGDAVATVAGSSAATSSVTSPEDLFTVECVVGFEHGLHARPAARVADAAKRFASQVTIAANGKTASARSAVAIMALDVRGGDTVVVSASGSDRDQAVQAVADVLRTKEQSAREEVAVTPNSPGDGIRGVCAVPGVALGTAFHWQRRRAEVQQPGRGVEQERGALAHAVAAVVDALNARSEALEGPASEVTRAHVGLLQDEDLQRAADERIVDGSSAVDAWMTATSAAAQSLCDTGNPRMQERIADLQDVCEQVVNALTGTATAEVELPEHAVLIADDLLPSEILALDRARLAGIALERGGATSHMAIIAASLGVPTIVAIGPKLWSVNSGARLLLDAYSGELVVDPSEEAAESASKRSRVGSSRTNAAATSDGETIALLANLGGVEEVASAVSAGAQGCGLLRTEFLFLDREVPPTVEEQSHAYQQIADALSGRPLTLRTLDIGGDKPVPFIKFEHEENPALGARGIRTRLIDPELIDNQLRAIALVRSDVLKIMVPMISSVDELRGVRARLRELSDKATVQVGTMIETPAAALIAGKLAAEADFLSIGTNDLAQYTLAMDRTNALLAPQIDALHPAVIRLIATTAEAGRNAGIPVSVCGSLAFDPIGAQLLVGLGIRELSGAAAMLPIVRSALSQVSVEDCRRFAEQALEQESAAQVRALAGNLCGAGR